MIRIAVYTVENSKVTEMVPFHVNHVETIQVISNRCKYTIDQSYIQYLESQGKRITIYTVAKVYQVWTPLSILLNSLEASQFIRIQRSYVVNVNYILRIERGNCQLKNGLMISVSRAYYNEVRSRFAIIQGGEVSKLM